MTQNNNVYVIAAGDKQIWAINPKTKQRLRIKLAKDISKIFDIYANNSGIYHACELIKSQEKKVDKYVESFNINYVQVVNSISGKTCATITPPGVDNMPLEKRFVPIKSL